MNHVSQRHINYLEFYSQPKFVEKDTLNSGIYMLNPCERFKRKDELYEAYNKCNYLEKPKGTHKWMIWLKKGARKKEFKKRKYYYTHYR